MCRRRLRRVTRVWPAATFLRVTFQKFLLGRSWPSGLGLQDLQWPGCPAASPECLLSRTSERNQCAFSRSKPTEHLAFSLSRYLSTRFVVRLFTSNNTSGRYLSTEPRAC